MPSPFIEYYSNHADKMDTYWHDFVLVQCDWLMNRLKIIFPQDADFSVIDLGCGTGEMLSRIAEYFPNAALHGVDGTPEMVRQASQKLKGRAVITQADLKDFKFDNRYDVILSTTVLHHLESPSDHLDQMHGGLKDEGHVFVSEIAINTYRLYFAQLWWSLTQKSHKQAWDENDFRYLIKSCNFKIVNGAILQPDNFWRLQMYHLETAKNLSSTRIK